MKFTFPPESKPLDGYTIKRAIHRGGFGEVYYALSDAGKEVFAQFDRIDGAVGDPRAQLQGRHVVICFSHGDGA